MISGVKPAYGGVSGAGLGQRGERECSQRPCMRTCTSPAHPLIRLPGERAEAVVITLLLLLLLLLPTLRRVLKFAAT